MPHPAPGTHQRWRDIRWHAARLVPGAVAVWCLVFLTGVVLTHPLSDAGFSSWEGGADRWFAGHRSAGWNTLTNVASLAGDTPAAIALSVLAFFALRLILHRWRESMLLAVSMLGEVAIFSSVASAVGRHRPAVSHLDGSPPTSSFPSGHTAAATVFYGILVLVVFRYCKRFVWRFLAVAFASFVVLSIGLSRLYRGMHFPTDICGGIELGLLWITVTWFVLLRGHARAE